MENYDGKGTQCQNLHKLETKFTTIKLDLLIRRSKEKRYRISRIFDGEVEYASTHADYSYAKQIYITQKRPFERRSIYEK